MNLQSTSYFTPAFFVERKHKKTREGQLDSHSKWSEISPTETNAG